MALQRSGTSDVFAAQGEEGFQRGGAVSLSRKEDMLTIKCSQMGVVCDQRTNR